MCQYSIQNYLINLTLLFEATFTACHQGDYTHFQIHYAAAHGMHAASLLYLFSDVFDEAACSQRIILY